MKDGTLDYLMQDKNKNHGFSLQIDYFIKSATSKSQNKERSFRSGIVLCCHTRVISRQAEAVMQQLVIQNP